MSDIQVNLTETGPAFSRIVSGVMTWGVWGKKYNTAEMQQLIEECVESGISTFDHADIYGGYTTEEEWGKALKASYIDRKDIQIITKCGIKLTTPNRPTYKIKSYDTSADHIQLSVENSLRYLQTDYIDLLLIHRPDPLLDPEAVAEVIENLKGQGKVKWFGVSNFTKDQFELLNSYTPLTTNQIEASLLHLEPLYDGTLDQCQQLLIRPMAWSPIGSGKIFDLEQKEILKIRAKADEICQRYDNTFHVDQLLLAWLMKHPSGILPVIGSGRIARIQKAIAACDITITREEWFEMLEASRGHEIA
ncbi:MAG: aldo/keto reductase [Bacteroidia bacterium]|nr:aldo/keto reductase [Bacteroidia bacterium]